LRLLGGSFHSTGPSVIDGLVMFLSVLHLLDVVRVGGSGFSSSSSVMILRSVFRFFIHFGNYTMRINKNHPNIIVIQTTTGNNDTNNDKKFKSDFTMFLRCWICCCREDKNQGHHSQDTKYLQVTFTK
jgi:hypothetical protein